jgi:branched-chain amino acid transport system substrate-binding protein
MLKAMQELFGVQKASIIVENGSYGQELLETMMANAADFRIELGTPLTIVPKQDVDFNAVLLKAQAENPDMLVILVERNEGGMIVSQARKLGWDIPIYGPKSLGEPQFFELAGEPLGQVYLTFTPSLDATDPVVQNFLANWGEFYDYPPDMAAIYGYDSVKIALAVIEAGGVDRESFIAKLRTVQVPGIGNPLYSFNENGDVQVPNLITISGRYFKTEFLEQE